MLEKLDLLSAASRENLNFQTKQNTEEKCNLKLLKEFYMFLLGAAVH